MQRTRNIVVCHGDGLSWQKNPGKAENYCLVALRAVASVVGDIYCENKMMGDRQMQILCEPLSPRSVTIFCRFLLFTKGSGIYLRLDSKLSQICLKYVPKWSESCSKFVSKMSQRCLQVVSKFFQVVPKCCPCSYQVVTSAFINVPAWPRDMLSVACNLVVIEDRCDRKKTGRVRVLVVVSFAGRDGYKSSWRR